MSNETRSLLDMLHGDANGHMTIHQCVKVSKDAKMDHHDVSFDLVGPTGRVSCRWLDVWMQLFLIDGQDGFLRVCDVEMAHDVHVENVQIIGMEVEVGAPSSPETLSEGD